MLTFVCADGAEVYCKDQAGLNLVAMKELRAQRNDVLVETDWLALRHRDELDAGGDPTLTAAEYDELLAYRQSLRNLPANTTDPTDPTWPTPPAFL